MGGMAYLSRPAIRVILLILRIENDHGQMRQLLDIKEILNKQ